MTEEQRVNAICELARGLSVDDFEGLESDLEDIKQAICGGAGHAVTDDMCGRPAHRYCYRCYKVLPDAEIPAREAKVNEAVVCKATEPSESLGSGSSF